VDSRLRGNDAGAGLHCTAFSGMVYFDTAIVSNLG